MKNNFRPRLHLITTLIVLIIFNGIGQSLTYPIVETGVHEFYNNSSIISKPAPGNAFYGQDATYEGNESSYTDNGNGTITDNVTGLIWQKDMGAKITFAAATKKADTMKLGGYTDWRVPTIKELYSLILYTGRVMGDNAINKFIDTTFFIQPIGKTNMGEREIDAQTWSSTHYNGLTMNGDSTLFGVNFVDGRIKGYPKYQPGSGNTVPNKMYFRMVRGNPKYGINNFINNNDGTITDLATGLMWQQADDGIARNWESAISYAENLNLATKSDWRLPNAKELQSIVDYTRSPSATNSPAINPIFKTSKINNPEGMPGHYPYFWTSTTLKDGPNPYTAAIYIPFGKAYGKMNGVLLDTHGAGALRSDPKDGNPSSYPQYFGPQGDALIVFNHTRCVRNVFNTTTTNEFFNDYKPFVFPNPVSNICNIVFGKEYNLIRIIIFNSFGNYVKDFEIEKSAIIRMDISSLQSGVYFINAYYDNHLCSMKISKL